MPSAIRIMVLLPVTTLAHREACWNSIRRLQQRFGKGWTLSWFHNRPEELPRVPFVGYPVWAGGWPDQDGVDYDTHVTFLGHVLPNSEDDQSTLDELVELIETEIHEVYSRHAEDGPGVKQKVIFVEGTMVCTNNLAGWKQVALGFDQPGGAQAPSAD